MWASCQLLWIAYTYCYTQLLSRRAIGRPYESAANCIPPGEDALDLTAGDIEIDGEMGSGGGGGVERGKRERVFEYHCVKTVKKIYKTFYLKAMFEVRHCRLIVYLICLTPVEIVLLYNLQYCNVPFCDFENMQVSAYLNLLLCRYRFGDNISDKKSPPSDLDDEIQYCNSTYREMKLHSSDMD